MRRLSDIEDLLIRLREADSSQEVQRIRDELLQALTPAAPQRTIPLPLGHGEWAMIQAAFPVTEEAWRLMMVVLEAMKGGLVRQVAAGGDDALAALEETP